MWWPKRGLGVARRWRRWFAKQSKLSEREKEIVKVLRTVYDSEGQDVVYKGLISGVKANEEGLVSISLQLTTDYRDLKKKCETAVNQLPWANVCRVSMAPARTGPPGQGQKDASSASPGSPLYSPQEATPSEGKKGLRGVKNTIAVSSCKGGVGKSTVSVNLAYALHKAGYKVGIYDSDIYGPSLPTMVTPPDPILRMGQNNLIIAPSYMGVKVMSFGFNNPYDPISTDQKARQSTIMRGPRASRVVEQLALDTDWGDLDYLVVDFPPGTGDIHLTLAQTLNFSSAVVVTTPQKLAHVDVVKGMDMFDKVNVPIIALLENMAYFECGSCGERAYPFGTGKTEEVAELFGLSNFYRIPIRTELSEHGDKGDPIVLSEEKHLESLVKSYDEIADVVVTETRRLKETKGKYGVSIPVVSEEGLDIKLTKPEGDEFWVPSVVLRKSCKGAGNNPNFVKDDVTAKQITPRGNYAVSILWSDSHSSLFSYDHIEQLANKTRLP
ncbi:hypothetical protein AAMO2058_000196500 [Amorphochlora amoebiformis]